MAIGETLDPVPMANPGPINHEVAHPTKSGRNASCPTVSATPPMIPACDCSYRVMTSANEVKSSRPTSTAATPTTTAVAAVPARRPNPATDRQTAGMRSTRSMTRWVPASAGRSRRRRQTSEAASAGIPNQSAGSTTACQSVGRVAAEVDDSATARPRSATTAVPTSSPVARCSVSANRRPARAPSQAVTTANPRAARVTWMGSAAPLTPVLLASADPSRNETSTPCPTSHTLPVAFQNTSQSICRPYSNPQSSVRGTRAIPMPTPTVTTASIAASRAVPRRFIAARIREPQPERREARRGTRTEPPGFVPTVCRALVASGRRRPRAAARRSRTASCRP